MFELWAYLQGKEVEEIVREWHTWWIGYFEGVCLGIRAKFPRTAFAIKEMETEEHYYHWGRGFGYVSGFVIIAMLIKAVLI